MENMNVEAAIKMVKAEATKEEIERAGLTRLMPERAHVKGKAPGLTTKELFARMNTNAKILDEGGKIVTKWTEICTTTMDKEKSELMGKVK